MPSFHYPITVDEITSQYKDDIECNDAIYRFFESLFQSDEKIWNHRLYVEEHKLGWGDRAFHGMWKVLIDSMPSNFTFLEIGVFKGQILSLIGLLARDHNKHVNLYGISPLDAVGDKYWKAPESDYLQNVKDMFDKFELPHPILHKGLSTDPDSFVFGVKVSPYDILYIDGGHDYDTVKYDIEHFTPLVKSGGLIVLDDASCHLNIDRNIINIGLEDVSNATRDCLESNPEFVNIFNCGHNRVFKKK